MLRHEFRPGRLVAGLFVSLAGVLYVGDATGAWDIPWFTVVPVVLGGFGLAVVTGLLTRRFRRTPDGTASAADGSSSAGAEPRIPR